ncbi:MAG: hypothetical protein ACOYOV_17660, partial [Bacteroidales bacterium]
IILLFDEYELLENKTEKRQISEDVFMFFANLMENHNILFVFSGSKKIRDRNPAYWKALFSKSIFRNISFLDKKDCAALITKPCEGYVVYNSEYIKLIYRITAGQPFYTQIFCQNMVDWLKSEQRNEVLREDLYKVIEDIIDHPIPQMIYFWNELSRNQKILLAIIAEIIQSGDASTDSPEILSYLKTNKLTYLLSLNEIHGTFEELYHLEILTKKTNEYHFRVDLFRYWIKQDQSIWKVINDYKDELKPLSHPKKKTGKIKIIAAALGVLIFMFSLVFFAKLIQIPIFDRTTHVDTISINKIIAGDSISHTDSSKPSSELEWWNRGLFYNNSSRSDQTSKFAFELILPSLEKFKSVNYNETGKTSKMGMNSENFAELIYKRVCINYSQPWNRKTLYTKKTQLKSGDLLIFANGDHLFYFSGWDKSHNLNKQIAIGMTSKGIHAVGFNTDSIRYIKSIEIEEYAKPETAKLIGKSAVEIKKNLIFELGLIRTEDFYKVLTTVLNCQSPNEKEKITVSSLKDNPQGFIAYVFAATFNLKQPDTSTRLSQADLQKWLKENKIHVNRIENGNTFKTGDLVFYLNNGKEYTMFYLNKKDIQYVIGMTENGVKMFKFDFIPHNGGIAINYFWSH